MTEFSGINCEPDDPSNPLSIFKLFFTDKIVKEILRCTSEYANTLSNTPKIIERINSKKKSLFANWVDTDVDEIWIYLTTLLLMGILIKPEIDMYWSNDPVLQTPISRRLISRNQFHILRVMTHFLDIAVYDKEDPLHKLRFFLDELQKNFESNYIREQNISIDEYLSLWIARLSFRVYIPSKRERYGLKLFMLCKSSTGYLSWFITYAGAGTNYEDCSDISLPEDKGRNLPTNFDEIKSPSKVVLSLMKPFLNKGYHLTLDNYYTSPELALLLDFNNTPCYGNLHKKEGLPKDFWLWKPAKGGVKIKMYDNLMIMRWNDITKTNNTKFVSMLSTIHIGELTDSGKSS